MSDKIKAECQCGHTVVVSEARGGMSLYGTLGFKMSRHSSCNTHNAKWDFDHGGVDTSVTVE